MEWVLCAIFIILLTTIIVGAILYISLNNLTKRIHSSKYILDFFKPKNKSSSMDEMIEFHKAQKDAKKYQL